MSTEPLRLFDPKESQRQQELAIARAEHGASEAWKQAAHSAVIVAACRHAEFTTDNVWEVLPPSLAAHADPRALGAVIRNAQKKGFCEPTDRFVKSDRVACHRRPLRVWRSRVYRG